MTLEKYFYVKKMGGLTSMLGLTGDWTTKKEQKKLLQHF